jgi:hypothetical protein
MHKVMAGGGLDVDMVTGLPRVKDPEVKKAEAQCRYEEAANKALSLVAELKNGSPGFQIAVRKYLERLIQLARKDRFCQAYESIILAYRHELEVAPLLAHNHVRRVVGPQLAEFVEEPEEPEAAPEGIPAA